MLSNIALRTTLVTLVTIALRALVILRRRRAFKKSLLTMGKDPEILRECAAINEEFASTMELVNLTRPHSNALNRKPICETLEALSAVIADEAFHRLPSDGASNHDKYLCGIINNT